MRAQITADLTQWDDITNHRTATIGDEQTGRWLADALIEAGAGGCLDEFHFRRREVAGSELVFSDGTRITGVPLFDGGITAASGISATAGVEISVMEFAPFDGDERTQALHAARAAGKHQGIIALCAGDAVHPGLAVVNAERFAEPYGPPVLQVATEHRQRLQHAVSNREAVRLIMNNKWHRTTAGNVVGKLEGRNPSLAPIVIMTPKSAWWTCTSERGGGIAAWLACAREFSNKQLRHPLIFTANTGHELGHVGLKHYLESNPQLIKNAHAWVHLGANFISHNAQLYLQASSAAWLDEMQEHFAFWDQQQLVRIPHDQRPLGEARDIYDGAGRYISLVANNRWFHHPDDRLDVSVDMNRAEQSAAAVLKLVKYLDDQ